MLTCKFLYALDGLYCTSEWRFECYWAQEAKRKRITTKCDEYFFCSTAKNYAWWWYDRFELSFDEIISGFVYFLVAILENQDWCSFIQIWNGLKTTNLLGYEFKLTFESTGLPLITIMKRRSQTNEFSHKKRLTLNAFNVMYLTNRFVIIRFSSASQCAKIFCVWSEIMHLTLTAGQIPVFLDCKAIWHWHFWRNIDITRGLWKKYVTKREATNTMLRFCSWSVRWK